MQRGNEQCWNIRLLSKDDSVWALGVFDATSLLWIQQEPPAVCTFDEIPFFSGGWAGSLETQPVRCQVTRLCVSCRTGQTYPVISPSPMHIDLSLLLFCVPVLHTVCYVPSIPAIGFQRMAAGKVEPFPFPGTLLGSPQQMLQARTRLWLFISEV